MTEIVGQGMHNDDKDADSGVAAILKAVVRNPAGALQIGVFIGSMFGMYYAIQGEITDVRAAQITNYEKLNGKLEQLVASDTDQRQKLDAVYSRGDARYTNIIAKLSAHDVDIAKIVANLDFIVDQYKSGPNGTRLIPHVTTVPSPPVP